MESHFHQQNYYRIILGKNHTYAHQAFEEEFIGVDFDIDQPIQTKKYKNRKEFNKAYIPIYLAANPSKNKVSAGLACGMLYTVTHEMSIGDFIISPNGEGKYLVGKISGDYEYVKNTNLPHRRKVQWLETRLEKTEMSQQLRNSTGSISTVCKITHYSQEISRLLNPNFDQSQTNNAIEFALEKHLEDFLVKNWNKTELGKNYEIYHENGEIIGQQYPSDTGSIDILARSKDGKELLVVELKKGRASDSVVGQIQRYMGFVQEVIAEKDQIVKGIIIAQEDDIRIRRALSINPSIKFYTFKIDFKLLQE